MKKGKIGIDASAMLVARKNGYENYVYSLLWEMTNPEVNLEGIELVFYFHAGNPLADPSLLKQILPRFERFHHRVYNSSHLFGRFLPLYALIDRIDYLHLPVHNWSNWYPCPVGITFHDACGARLRGESSSEELRAHERRVERSVGLASSYIAVSNNSKQDLVSLYGVSDETVSVVYHGSDPFFQPSPAEAQQVRQSYNLTDYLLTINAVQTNKNYERLIEAFVRLRKEDRIPHELVIVGRDGLGANIINDKVAQAGEIVRRLGYVPKRDLPGLYSGAALIVNPSLCEGFGLTMLEAMQCGGVIAASRATSLPEVGGDAVLWFDPYSIEMMEATILQALTDQELRTKLRSRGIARAKQFTWRRAAVETLAAYRRWCLS